MTNARDWFWSANAQDSPRVWVIAELGVNHDGQVDRAVALVGDAARAGADAVKVQVFDPARLLSAEAVSAAYQGGAKTDPRTLLERLMLDEEQAASVRDAAHRAGLAFVATPFSLTDVDRLDRLQVDAVKIASPDAVNGPLIDRAAQLNRPMLISTGTCDLEELHPAANVLGGHPPGGAFLQCVSSYPTPPNQGALGGIGALADAFDLPIGYSDHTAGTHTGALAVAAGAVVLEKHLTHDQAAPGPDHAASLDADELADYVSRAHEAAAALGPRAKRVLEIEKDVHAVSRQSLCVVDDLPAGHTLQAADLTIKRPGLGLSPERWPQVLGRRLQKPVRADHLLRADDLDHDP